MNRKYGHPKFYKLLEEIADLHSRKNYQYATMADPLHNFTRTGEIIRKFLKPGIKPALASCLSLMSKQVDGVYEIVGENKEGTVDSLRDKLMDVAVYSLIAIIIAEEKSRREG